MLYTLFILLTGVYIGQEYTIVPSVKIVAVYCLNYLNSLKEVQVNQENEEITTYTWLLKKLKFL